MATDVESMAMDLAAAWLSHDVDKIASFFTDDGVFEDLPLEAVNRGKQEIKAYISATFAAWPDFKLEPTSLFFSGNWAAAEWIMTGTHAGDFAGMPATGKKFSVRGASVFEIMEAKLKRETLYYDKALFLRQVGLMPENPLR
jgi:steroid delta-isomerase-like uncharacterized protein